MVGPRPSPPPPVNSAPQPQVQPPGQMVIEGDTISADISGWFTDANGDELTYTASSAAEEIVQAWVAADSVHVAALAVGEASVTVRATDPGALWAEVGFLVTVEERNLAPEVARQIEPQQLFIGDSVSLVLSEHFIDPNGDTLIYMVSAGDAVEAEIRVDTLLLIGRAENTLDVVVTATDPDGLSAEQVFRVAIEERNLAPEVARQIEPQQLFIGDSVSLVLSEHFIDPNGDTLIYMVSAGDAVEAEIRVDTLLLIGRAENTLDVVVTATDPDGLSAEQVFRVAIEERNLAPEVARQIEPQQLFIGDSVSLVLSEHFIDPNGDTLIYMVSAGDAVEAEIRVDTLLLIGRAENTLDVVVTATDPDGLSAEQVFRVAIEERNLAPEVARQIEPQQLFIGDSVSLVLSEHFIDPNGDTLIYMVSAGDAVEAEIRVDTLLLIGRAENTLDVVVTATDPDGLSAEQVFRVAIEERNLAPEVARQIEPQQLFIGDSVSLVLSEHFIDPNGDTLIYMVSAGDAVEAEIRVDTLLLIGRAENTLDVVVTATDPDGLSAEQVFRVAIEERNLAPEVARQIDMQELSVGDTMRIRLSDHFTDPNGDALRYSAIGGDILGVSTSDDTLLLVGLVGGSTLVEVTATDPAGLSVSQSFGVNVTIPNMAPIALGELVLPPVYIRETVKMPCCDAFFTDPDGDRLVYRAVSGNREVLDAAILIDTLYLSGRRLGTTTLELVAHDSAGLGAAHTATVAVTRRPITPPPPPPPPSNQAPTVARQIPDQALQLGDTLAISLVGYFTDPNGDSLRYSASTEGGDIVAPRASSDSLYLEAVKVGEATVWVRASDPHGLSVRQSFKVTVTETTPPPPPPPPTSNQAPTVARQIPDQALQLGDTLAISLVGYFTDPNGDSLRYSASTEGGDIVAPRASSDSLYLEAVKVGEATVWVRASDPHGLSVRQSFKVTVTETTPPPPPPPPPGTNQAPVVSDSLPDWEANPGIVVRWATLHQHFSDPDADSLTYTATSSDTLIAKSRISGVDLHLHAIAVGVAEVAIRAADPAGLFAEDTLLVTVKEVESTVSVRMPPAASNSVREGDTLRFEIVANPPPSSALKFAYRLEVASGEEQVTSIDATLLRGTLWGEGVIPAGQQMVTVEFPVIDDDLVESTRDTLIMSLLASHTYHLGSPPDTIILQEGVCDRAEPIMEQILFWGGYRQPWPDILETDLTQCHQPDSEILANLRRIRLVGPDPVTMDRVYVPSDTLMQMSPDETPLDGFISAPARVAQAPSYESLTFTQADFAGLTGVVDLWLIRWDLTDIDWSEGVFSGLDILEQLRIGDVTLADLPSSFLKGVNSGDATCPPRTLYRDLDGVSYCTLVSLALIRLEIESGAISRDLLDPAPSLIAFQMGFLPDVRNLPDAFFHDVPRLGNVVMGAMPLESLDADLFARNPELFQIVMDTILIENSLSLPANLFANQRELIVLSLAKNGLTEVPTTAFSSEMPELTRLGLANNEIGTLEAEFLAPFTQLEELNLANNSLMELPRGFFSSLRGPLRNLNLSGNPGPDGDEMTSDFTLSAELVRVDTDTLSSSGPARVTIDVPLGAPAELNFELFAYAGGFGGDTDATRMPLTIDAGRTRSDTFEVTMSDTLPYSNYDTLTFDPLPAESGSNTHTELRVAPEQNVFSFVGLTLRGSDIAAMVLFDDSDGTGGVSTMPRQVRPLPVFRLLKGAKFWPTVIPGAPSVTGGQAYGSMTISLGDYFERTATSAGDEFDSVYVVPIIPTGLESTGDSLGGVTALGGDCVAAVCGGLTIYPTLLDTGEYVIPIDAFEASTGSTLQTAVRFVISEPDSTKLDIEWIDANDNLPRVVAAAMDSAVGRWGSLLGDIRDARTSQNVAARLGCFGAGAKDSYLAIDDVIILVDARHDDGPGGTLAAAAPCFIRDESDAPRRSLGRYLPILGYFYLDLDDIDRMVEANLLVATITHEVGHILGIGTGVRSEGPLPGSWYAQNECAANPSSCFHGRHRDPYVPGTNARRAFDRLGGVSTEGDRLYFGRRVPIEPGRRQGSSGGHWREDVLVEEMMTPYVDRDMGNPLSEITVRIMQDLGYALRSGWQNHVDSYCILTITPLPRTTHPCAPSAQLELRSGYGRSAEEKAAEGLGFDLRGDILEGPIWIVGSDGRLRRAR